MGPFAPRHGAGLSQWNAPGPQYGRLRAASRARRAGRSVRAGGGTGRGHRHGDARASAPGRSRSSPPAGAGAFRGHGGAVAAALSRPAGRARRRRRTGPLHPAPGSGDGHRFLPASGLPAAPHASGRHRRVPRRARRRAAESSIPIPGRAVSSSCARGFAAKPATGYGSTCLRPGSCCCATPTRPIPPEETEPVFRSARRACPEGPSRLGIARTSGFVS